MANADTVAFNFAAFVATLFLLEFGADKFIDHTAIVSQRVGVSQAIIALLTAGAEWEEASGAATHIRNECMPLTFAARHCHRVTFSRPVLARGGKCCRSSDLEHLGCLLPGTSIPHAWQHDRIR